MRPSRAGALIALFVLSTLGRAGAVTIDGFGTGSLVFVPAASTSESQVSGPMLGGERDETIGNASPSGGILAGVSGGAYSYGALSATGSALLVWDGADGDAALDPTGLGGVDLTEGGTQFGFSIQIESNDFPALLVLTVYSTASDFSQVTVSTPGGIPSGPAQTLGIAFASLTATGSGADFADVGAISLLIDGSSQPQLDISLGAFSTSAVVVPEPETFVQLSLGLAVLAGMRVSRRRRGTRESRWTGTPERSRAR
jgi:hypothetical protein